jgi:hypothetical protein
MHRMPLHLEAEQETKNVLESGKAFFLAVFCCIIILDFFGNKKSSFP